MCVCAHAEVERGAGSMNISSLDSMPSSMFQKSTGWLLLNRHQQFVIIVSINVPVVIIPVDCFCAVPDSPWLINQTHRLTEVQSTSPLEGIQECHLHCGQGNKRWGLGGYLYGDFTW